MFWAKPLLLGFLVVVLAQAKRHIPCGRSETDEQQCPEENALFCAHYKIKRRGDPEKTKYTLKRLKFGGKRLGKLKAHIKGSIQLPFTELNSTKLMEGMVRSAMNGTSVGWVQKIEEESVGQIKVCFEKPERKRKNKSKGKPKNKAEKKRKRKNKRKGKKSRKNRKNSDGTE